MMKSMSRQTGNLISEEEAILQNIEDILTTPLGTRIMQRDYGSRLYELLDSPTNPGFFTELYTATAEAIDRWEKRFRVLQVKVTSVSEGKVTLELDGVVLSSNRPLNLKIGIART